MAVSYPEDTARGDGAADTDSNLWASANVLLICVWKLMLSLKPLMRAGK